MRGRRSGQTAPTSSRTYGPPKLQPGCESGHWCCSSALRVSPWKPTAPNSCHCKGYAAQTRQLTDGLPSAGSIALTFTSHQSTISLKPHVRCKSRCKPFTRHRCLLSPCVCRGKFTLLRCMHTHAGLWQSRAQYTTVHALPCCHGQVLAHIPPAVTVAHTCASVTACTASFTPWWWEDSLCAHRCAMLCTPCCVRCAVYAVCCAGA